MRLQLLRAFLVTAGFGWAISVYGVFASWPASFSLPRGSSYWFTACGWAWSRFRSTLTPRFASLRGLGSGFSGWKRGDEVL